ncbi:MAG: DUF3810 domain-containing protein [Flavobacteriaceae bacterium]|nr:DUF3810 domain-containing protein [Flavobacteriaceae bacterium]MDZ4148056.1 DUF3810 domain-containing protein [Flavobacteriaceae bacterium]
MKHTRYFLVLFAVLIIGTQLISVFPEFVETYYSKGIYPILSAGLRMAFGWLPFSFGDFIYISSIVLIIRWFALHFKDAYRKPKWFFSVILISVTVIYALFLTLWGFNYYRLPVYQSMQLKPEYTTEQLEKTIDFLTEKSNALQLSLAKNDTLRVDIPYERDEIYKRSFLGYESLATSFPQFEFNHTSLKTSTYSTPLTYMGFSGYLNPITNEAQVDGIMPLNKMPITVLHEQAHQLGYAAENEANFVGYLAAIHHPDAYFRYAGYTFALRYCLNELAQRDRESFEISLKKVNKGILKNYQESTDFWKKYENPFEPVFAKTFDTYLKANQQKQGIKSYNYVVGLLVAYSQLEY